MSLTSLINGKEVKTKFSNLFPLPKIKLGKRMLANPVSNRYALVGTAFDYLLRFHIEKINKNVLSSSWVAELAPQALYNSKDLHKIATKILCKAKLDFYDYIEGGKLKKSLLSNSILLAKLDWLYRTWEIPTEEELTAVYPEDIKDLRKLITIVNPEAFKAKKKAILNPTFGDSSYDIGGADADLMIDNTLIEIKTTKLLKVKKDYYHQLIGYYLLSLIEADKKYGEKYKIRNLAIYFSRHAELVVFSVKNITSIRGFSSFLKWFKKLLQK